MNNLSETAPASSPAEGDGFTISSGLIKALRSWNWDRKNLGKLNEISAFHVMCLGLCSYVSTHRHNLKIKEELDSLLERDFNTSCFPFVDSFATYCVERDNQIAHLNPARIAWVESILEEFAHVA